MFGGAPCRVAAARDFAREARAGAMGRIRRVRHGGVGIRRRGRGRGFSYIGIDGRTLKDREELERIRSLAIPPAWTDVWICPNPDGHLQAVGTDAAGRLQYRYHSRWRASRDSQKFARIEGFAERLTQVRQVYRADITKKGMPRERALAGAVAMLDEGLFRIGTEQYTEENGSFGLATLRKDHVRIRDGAAVFDFVAKSGKRRRQRVTDPDVVALIARLKRRRNGGDELLAFLDKEGWHDVRSSDINAYLKDLAGEDVSAKDFRTWHATVFAAVRLAIAGTEEPPISVRRAIPRIAREVAEALGNTPAVARNSYIDPRVFDRFEEGETILPAIRGMDESALEDPSTRTEIEAAVLALLRGERTTRSIAA